MKVRFQADADFNKNIVRAVRRRAPAIDFQTAHDARLHGVDDAMVLARAMVSQAIPLSDVVADLLLIWEASEAEEWINRFDTLPL